MKIGTCLGCKRSDVWVNLSDRVRLVGDYCAACFERLNLEPPRDSRTKRGVPARTDEGPAWDDAVRAYEEDR